MAQQLKRSAASLFGGIAVALGVLILWLLIAGSLSPSVIAIGLVLATAVGAWVRLADL
jgi:multisubunit Na+/H+ antiporter MnhE subunit